MTTIFAPITSIAGSSVVIIRISGEKTKDVLKEIGFKGELTHQKTSLQKIIDPKNNQILDEALVTFFKSPHSFTGEDVAEISLHASPFIVKKICAILSDVDDCRLAEAGEFSKTAFLNNKFDLTQAEAIVDLIKSETELQHQQSLKQLSGSLGKIYDNWTFELIEISALIEAAIDFPDEDLPTDIVDGVIKRVENLKKEIKEHLNDGQIAQKIKDGLNLAIIGAPNVGKSSLINFLAKSDVAIVSDIAGTTRDIVEVHLEISGMQVKISDTAGIRETQDKIEKLGIDRAITKSKEADLKIYLIDASNPIIQDELIDKNTILIANKIDLTNNGDFNDCNVEVNLSLKDKFNTNKLFEILSKKILELVPKQNQSLITSQRYRSALESALNNLNNFSLDKNIELAAEDLRLASVEIGKITGRVDVEKILDVIFSKFCIGK
ncbi:MAG: tRNA uridine-5-carboxymethylaminomethyl(34) synthesis GTPase MnmE [Rickettsiales bacterium]|nr:tRNA uridine-5-carboxymethylaminomethyl(34) synthesis GTPase MnmE [Rickettsiales bacterium]